ncbi:MAG TPA: glycosyltransferase [Armatimonadetes bacterium]|nr:glycosyltransferase [Armatimonadota bacterium]
MRESASEVTSPAATGEGEMPEVSAVIPVYNERESLPELHGQLVEVLTRLGRSWEIVYVDDGSTDGSFEQLRELHAASPSGRVVVIRLRANFGQTAALAAGFDRARGTVIVALDADLQNDPADIPRLLAKLEEGYDVVSGWRKRRQDKFLTCRLPSWIANWLIGQVTGVRLHDYGCSLKAYRAEILREVRLYGELHRFIPALAKWVGARIGEIEVSHRPRKFGRSKYGLSRTSRVLLDLLTVKFLLSFSTKPMQMFGRWGLWLGSSGFVLAAYLTYLKFFHGEQLAERPLLLLAVLLMILGLQMVSLGLLGELVIRTYHESQGRPIYRVRETLE